MAITVASGPEVTPDPLLPESVPAGSRVFIDTNVLVYAVSQHSPWYRAARERLVDLSRADAQLWISRQVIREFLAATSRPTGLTRPLSVQEARRTVEWVTRVARIAEEDALVTRRLLDLLEDPGAQGKQVHDANIVATMRRYGIPFLLTHNGEDFVRYEPDVIVLPLLTGDPL
jgi:predicted nucleic acid-binding protein